MNVDILGLLGKLVTAGPAIMAFVEAQIAAFTALAKALGLNIPVATAHDAETQAAVARVVEAHKLGDGTILNGLIGLLNSPLGQLLEQLLLGAINKKPTA